MKTSFAALLVVAVGSAQGQFLAPPPPAERGLDRPVYVPPRPPLEKERELLAKNRARILAERERERIRREEHSVLPDLPYESLVVMGDDGRVERLTSDPHMEALDRNPMLTDETRAEALAIAMDRAAKIEQMVVDQIDAVMRLDELANAPFSLEVATEMADIKKSLGLTSTLTDHLRAEGVLTIVQARFSNAIVKEYDDAMKKQELGETPDVMDAMGYTVRLGVRDALVAYEALLDTAARDIDVVVEEAGLDPGTATRLAEAVASAPRDRRGRALGEVLHQSPSAVRQAVMQLARDIRAAGE